jgi:hypothetical protein
MNWKQAYKWLVIGVVGAIVFPGLNDVGAEVEEAFFPVVERQATYGGHWRNPRVFCWRWAGAKVRDGEPADYTAIVVLLPDDRKALLPAYRGDEDRPLEPGKAKPAGGHFDALLCSVMPIWVTEKTPFDIVGSVVYARWHGLWNVRHDIPRLEWRP